MDVISFRDFVRPGDKATVARIVSSSGFFSYDEIRVAVELVGETLMHGSSSGYRFVFAEDQSSVTGYACYGPIPMTRSSWDLYWIAVRDDLRGGGIGRMLMQEVEKSVLEHGGRKIFIDTSSRAQYEPTREYYERCGYVAEAVLTDFYAPGDSKSIYSKTLNDG